MSIIAARVINGARDRHPLFDPEHTPPRVALRALSDYVQELHGKVAAIDEGALAVALATAMPLGDFAEGITLPANRYVQEASYVTAGEEFPIDLVPFAHRFDPRRTRNPLAWVQDGALHLEGQASDWAAATEVRVRYVPVPAELAADTDTLPLPDTARRACVEYVAGFMATRAAEGLDATVFLARAEAAEREFLADVGNRRTAVVFRTRDTRLY